MLSAAKPNGAALSAIDQHAFAGAFDQVARAGDVTIRSVK
jgi:hypothetical protein